MDHGYKECYYGGQGFMNVRATWLVNIFIVIYVLKCTLLRLDVYSLWRSPSLKISYDHPSLRSLMIDHSLYFNEPIHHTSDLSQQ